MKDFKQIYNEFYLLHSKYVRNLLEGIEVSYENEQKVETKEMEAVNAFFRLLDSDKNCSYESYLADYINSSVTRSDCTLAQFALDLLEERKPEDLSKNICVLIEFLVENQPVSSFRVSIIERLIEILRFYKNPFIVPTLRILAKIRTEDEVSAYAVKTINLLSLINNDESRSGLRDFQKSTNPDIAFESERILNSK
jgi:hypothetical protein